MAVRKEDYFKVWNVKTFNGPDPSLMMDRVEICTRIAFAPGAALDEVRCVHSKYYSKRDDDLWDQTSIKVGNNGGNAYLYCTIGPNDDPVEFHIADDNLHEITCRMTTQPTGTWSGDDD